MKKSMFLGVICAILVLFSCSKDETVQKDSIVLTSKEKFEKVVAVPSTELLVRQWKLVSLVNISDVEKYVNAVLDIKSNQEFVHTSNSGQIASQGTWTLSSSMLTLSKSLFGDSLSTPVYKVFQCNSDSLILIEHYTLDGKDAYLEYHYAVILSGKEKFEKVVNIPSTDLFIRKWRLASVVNIGDEYKYVNAILDITSNHEFVHTYNDGITKRQGTWTFANDFLTLSTTLFNNGGTPVYKAYLCNTDSLILIEHYTLGGKDSYLEHHYTSNLK